MSDSEEWDDTAFAAPQQKRVVWKSYNEKLKDVHIPSALQTTSLDFEVEEQDSHFHASIQHWREINVQRSFLAFCRRVERMSRSMALLIHNWKEIVQIWTEVTESAEEDALQPLLEMMQSLVHDLRTTLLPVYPTVLSTVLNLLPPKFPSGPGPSQPRKLSPQTLQVVLKLLSTIFRYILLPNPQTLNPSWTLMREAIIGATRRKGSGVTGEQMERMLAEVWGALLRKLRKKDMVEEAVRLLADGIEGCEEAVAWVIVSAVEAPSQSIHPSASLIISCLLECYCSSNSMNEVSLSKLLRRCITSFANHTSKAMQFEPVATVLFGAYRREVHAETIDANDRLCRLWKVLMFACATKGGSRVTAKDISGLLTLTAGSPALSPSLSPLQKETVIEFASAALIAGDMTCWMGPGKNFVQQIWDMDALVGLKLSAVLAELDWNGWKLIVLPQVVKHSSSVLQASLSSSDALSILSYLHSSHRLDDTSQSFRNEIGDWVASRLTSISESLDGELNLSDLRAIAEMSTFFSSPRLNRVAIDIADRCFNLVADEADAKSRFNRSSDNIARLLARCLDLVCARTDKANMEEASAENVHIDTNKWVRRTMEVWSWHPGVMGSFVGYLERADKSNKIASLPFASIYQHLKQSFLSPERSLRLAAIKFLLSPFVSRNTSQDHFLRKIAEAEEVPIEFHALKDRVTRIATVTRDTRDLDFEVIAPWLVAQLKVNFRPLWRTSIRGLTEVVRADTRAGWDLIFGELQKIGSSDDKLDDLGVINPPWRENLAEEEDVDPLDYEKSWNDVNRHNTVVAVATFGRLLEIRRKTQAIRDQVPERQLDVPNYEAQLMALLSEVPQVAERHHDEFIAYFLAQNTPPMPRRRLMLYLNVLSKFRKPGSLKEADGLRALYTSLLMRPERVLQRAALAGILSFQSPNLKPHEEKLHNLVDDKLWRAGISEWNFDEMPPYEREEVVPVVLRLLYGLLMNRRGTDKSAKRRTAILGVIGRAAPEELRTFINLMLGLYGGLPACSDHIRDGSLYSLRSATTGVTRGQMLGFLSLLQDVMRMLGPKLANYWSALFATTLEIAAFAQKEAENAMDITSLPAAERRGSPNEAEAAEPANDQDSSDEEGEDSDHEADEPDEPDERDGEDGSKSVADDDVSPSLPRSRRWRQSSKSARVLRKLALERLDSFFNSSIPFDYTPYMPAVFSSLITPRLARLHRENMAKAGSLLPLVVTWSKAPTYLPFLRDYDNNLLPTIFNCLGLPHVGYELSNRIFTVVEYLVQLFNTEYDALAKSVLEPHLGCLLENLRAMVEQKTISKSTRAVQRQVEILSLVAPYIANDSQATHLLALLLPSLRQPTRMVQEPIKANLLKVVQTLCSTVTVIRDPTSPLFEEVYKTISSLSDSLSQKEAREALVGVFDALAALHEDLAAIRDIYRGLNSFEHRTGDPDVGRRLEAFAILNEVVFRDLTARQWQPLLAVIFFTIRDTTEFSLRNTAVHALRRVVELAASGAADSLRLFSDSLYPTLRKMLVSGKEEARSEMLGVLSYAVEKEVGHPTIQDLAPLLSGGKEADVLLNMYHVQAHLRIRALHRLGDACDKGMLETSTLVDIFVPIIAGFVADRSNRSLSDEAVVTIGKVAGCVDWPAYYALFRQFFTPAKVKTPERKTLIRATVSVLDHFHFDMQSATDEDSVPGQPANRQDDAEEDGPAEDAMDVTEDAVVSQGQRIYKVVKQRMLPDLLRFMEAKEETEESVRLPMSLGVVKIALHLPASQRNGHVSRLLTIISQTFQSRDGDVRSQARDTIIKVMVALGSDWLPTLVKDLRLALTRGPQKHILATVVHVVLKHLTAPENAERFTGVDGCVEDIVNIASEVIFGESATNTQAEGFKSSTKEVSGSSGRGQETFMLLAKHVSPAKISRILEPVRAILHETSSLKMLNLVDEVLRRVASGLNANPALSPEDILSLCYALITQNAKFLQQAPEFKKQRGGKKRREVTVSRDIAVDLKVQRVVERVTDHYVSNSFRFVCLGLELFVTSFRKRRFAVESPEMVARLEPFVSIIGETLYSSQAKVLVLGLRATVAIARCPLSTLPTTLPALLGRTISIMKEAGTTESEVVQTALKTVSSFLRDSPQLKIQEEDLTFVLNFIAPDLEEHSRQETAFLLLKAIIERKFVAPEIYDAMDRVAEVMVTSQANKTRALARTVYLLFITDFPQGKARMKTTMEFLARNLSYVHEPGRLSVMELLGSVFEIFRLELLAEYYHLFFVALVMVLANDDSPKCRETAAALLVALFTRMEDSQRSATMKNLRLWSEQSSKPVLRRVAIQVYGLVMTALGPDGQPYVDPILDTIRSGLLEVTKASQARESSDLTEVTGEDQKTLPDDEWRLAHQSLNTLVKVLKTFPNVTIQFSKIPWGSIFELQLYPHAWVRTVVTRLQGLLYSAVPVKAPDLNQPADHPLSLDNLCESARRLSVQLKSRHLDNSASLQIVKNLFYIGRSFYLLSKEKHTNVQVRFREGDYGEGMDDVQDGDAVSESEESPQEELSHINPNLGVKSPLGWMFWALSRHAKMSLHRRFVTKTAAHNWSEQPSAIVRWFAAMASHLDVPTTERFLPEMISPLFRIVETKAENDNAFAELKTLAVELQQMLQTKVGATKYSFAYNEVRQGAAKARNERKEMKKSQAIDDPEAYQQRKEHETKAKKDKRKRKAEETAAKQRDLKKYKYL